MRLSYHDFKGEVNKARVYLPYFFVLNELTDSGKIKKLTHSYLTDETILEYESKDLVEDIISLRKEYYIVSSLRENLPKDWLRFNEVIFEVSRQCSENISFYMPYYDPSLSSYLIDLSDLKIEKKITLYPPEREFNLTESQKALEKFRTAGFECKFASPGDHAKVYLFDDEAALVGSFNFTENAAYTNKELGVFFFGRDIRKIREFMDFSP